MERATVSRATIAFDDGAMPLIRHWECPEGGQPIVEITFVPPHTTGLRNIEVRCDPVVFLSSLAAQSAALLAHIIAKEKEEE